MEDIPSPIYRFSDDEYESSENILETWGALRRSKKKHWDAYQVKIRKFLKIVALLLSDIGIAYKVWGMYRLVTKLKHLIRAITYQTTLKTT